MMLKIVPANMFCYFSSAKATKELGYKHRPATEALEASVTWMMKNLSQFQTQKQQTGRFKSKAIGAIVLFGVLAFVALRQIIGH
jgi:hypothetical protein